MCRPWRGLVVDSPEPHEMVEMPLRLQKASWLQMSRYPRIIQGIFMGDLSTCADRLRAQPPWLTSKRGPSRTLRLDH